MAETTGIGWTDSTASPWFGCTEVSPGCAHCYARELTLKRKWAGWGDNSPRIRSKGFWEQVPRWNKTSPGKRVFPSLMDWLDLMVPIELFCEFLGVVRQCNNLRWQLLTKRIENFQQRMEDATKWCLFEDRNVELALWIQAWVNGIPPKHVWLGVTVEDDAPDRLDRLMTLIHRVPANIRFASMEPLLKPVDMKFNTWSFHAVAKPLFHWMIIGGESGPNRRDCGVEAIIELAQQCVMADVPVYVKQDCSLHSGRQGRIPDNIWKLKQMPR